MRTEVVLGLGSNLGDRAKHLGQGVRALSEALSGVTVSSIYESPAAIFEDQPDFLNLVAAGSTTLSPRPLLDFIQGIERNAGRVRSFRAAPRTLDIDILLFGDLRIEEEDLMIPHPAWRERAFVLAPMAEIVPGRVDPESGKSVDELWRDRARLLPEVRIFAPPPSLEEKP